MPLWHLYVAQCCSTRPAPRPRRPVQSSTAAPQRPIPAADRRIVNARPAFAASNDGTIGPGRLAWSGPGPVVGESVPVRGWSSANCDQRLNLAATPVTFPFSARQAPPLSIRVDRPVEAGSDAGGVGSGRTQLLSFTGLSPIVAGRRLGRWHFRRAGWVAAC